MGYKKTAAKDEATTDSQFGSALVVTDPTIAMANDVSLAVVIKFILLCPGLVPFEHMGEWLNL